MPKFDDIIPKEQRNIYLAFSCLLMVLCGFAITRPTVQFEKGLLIWSVCCISCGLVLRYPPSGDIVEAFESAGWPAATLIATIVTKTAVVFLFGGLSSESFTIRTNPTMSAAPILLALYPLIFFGVLLVIICAASTVLIAISSLASDYISHLGRRAFSLEPVQVNKAEKLIKAFTTLVTAVYVLWATIA